MKYIKKFNESNNDVQRYDHFLNTMKECFLEFTDEGWEWATNNVFPFFDCILYRYKPKQIGEEKIDIRGSI